MANLYSAWSNFWMDLTSVISIFSLRDAFDIAIMSYIIYKALQLVRETRAMQLVKGITAVLAFYFVATLTKMVSLSFFMDYLLQVGLFALIVVFQPEMRRALEQLGRTKIASRFGRFGGTSEFDETKHAATLDMIESVCACCTELSESHTGALIVIERETRLGDVINTGTALDAAPAKVLMQNIFFPNSPLHDGAMIIRKNRIRAAGCFLPLSENSEIGRELGTRHRAALGVSEVSDALVVVVSEETGAITVALDSKLQRKLSPQNLQKLLQAKLVGHKAAETADGAEHTTQPEEKSTSFFRRKKK